MQGRISRRRLVSNPTIQQVVINMHTEYDYMYSSLRGCEGILDAQFHNNYSNNGKKEN